MHVPITLFALVCLTASLLALRQVWPRLGRRVQRLTLALAVLSILFSAQMFVLGWSTVSPFCNACIRWLAVAGYELLLILFTRFRPRWLTSLAAVVLLLPILATSSLLPLTFLFDRDPVRSTRLTPNLVVTMTPWDAAGMGNRGVDASLSRILTALPFLRHQIISVRLYDSQCDTGATGASLDPSTATVTLHCPPNSSRPDSPAHDVAIPLR